MPGEAGGSGAASGCRRLKITLVQGAGGKRKPWLEKDVSQPTLLWGSGHSFREGEGARVKRARRSSLSRTEGAKGGALHRSAGTGGRLQGWRLDLEGVATCDCRCVCGVRGQRLGQSGC